MPRIQPNPCRVSCSSLNDDKDATGVTIACVIGTAAAASLSNRLLDDDTDTDDEDDDALKCGYNITRDEQGVEGLNIMHVCAYAYMFCPRHHSLMEML
jgi:hypothetical protein